MAIDPFAALNATGAAGSLTRNNNVSGFSLPQYAPPKQSFLGSVGHTLGSVGGAVVGAIDDSAKHGANLIQGTARQFGLDQRQNNLEQQRKTLEAKDMVIHQQYKAGQLSTQQYKESQASLLKEYQGLSSTAKGIQSDHYSAGAVAKDYLPVAGAALAVAAPFTAPIAVGATGAGEAAAAGTEALGSRAAQVAMQASRGVAKGINVATGAGKAPTSSVVGGLAKMVGRNTAFIQPTIQTASAVPEDLAKGNVAGAIGNAALLAAPAAVSGLSKLGKAVAPKIATSMYGKEGLFGAIAKAGGPDLVAHLDSLPANSSAKKGLEKVMRQWQDYKLAETNGDVNRAVHELINHFETAHRDFSTLDPKQWAKELKTFMYADMKANKLYKEGALQIGGEKLALRDGQSIGAYRYNTTDHTNLMGALKAADGVGGRLKVLAEQAKAGADWTKNPNVRSIIEHAVTNGGEDYAKEINSIVRNPGLFASKTGNTHLGGGYFAGIMDNKRAEFKALKDTAAVDRGKAPGAILGKLGGKLTSMGMSTQATDSGAVSRQLRATFASKLQDAGIGADPKKIYSALAKVDKAGANDARFLSKRDVSSALLGIDAGVDAGKVLKALRESYAELPKSLVGAGPAAVNKAIAKAPALATYMRLEQAGRYDSGLLSTPFRIKQFIKGSIVAAVEGRQVGVKATPAEIKSLREAGLVTQGHGGMDQGLSSTIGKSEQGTKLMFPEQEKILGGLAASIARSHGTTVDALIADKGELGKQFRNSMDLVHGYGHGGYLNSPMAKTLNIMIYPSRFDSKIAMEAAKAVSKLPAAGQIGLASGIANLSGFLGSPEGKKWQADNSEALGVIKAFTPLQTIENFDKFLGKGFHIGDLGQLGGLPVGVIGTILNHQGIDLGPLGTSQYPDPKTGKPVAESIPNTTKARVQQAMTDMIASMFSYPGRTAGLTSKTQVIKDVVPFLKQGKGETTLKYKDGTVAAQASKKKAPTGGTPLTINRGSAPTISPIAPIPRYKNGASKPSVKAPKRKIYGVRPT